MQKLSNRQLYCKGLKSGIPIAFGYFAIAFSLGLTMSVAGFNFFQGFLSSALLNASAGEYALVKCIVSGSLVSTILMMIITNSRYLLMSCALSQKLEPNTKFFHRFIVGFFITDEFFTLCMNEKDYFKPAFMYGAITVASPCWAVGTMLGVLVGEILPTIVVTSLCVSLYGMFLASIIPATKTSKIIAFTVFGSFIVSYLFSIIPFLKTIDESLRIIILTVVITTIVAILFPKKEDESNTANLEVNKEESETAEQEAKNE